MGKRKSSKKPMAKKGPPPLATTFDCIICNGSNTIHVSIDKKLQRANLVCKECQVEWYRPAKPRGMDEPVDVYYDWVDEAEKARLLAEDKRKRTAANRSLPPRRSITPDALPSGAATYHYDSNDDDNEEPREPAPRKDAVEGRAVVDDVSERDESDDEDQRERKKQKKSVAPIEYEEEDSD